MVVGLRRESSSSGNDAPGTLRVNLRSASAVLRACAAGPTAGPVKAGPVKAGAVTAGPVKAGAAKAGAVTAGPVKAGAAKAGAVTAGPVKGGAEEHDLLVVHEALGEPATSVARIEA